MAQVSILLFTLCSHFFWSPYDNVLSINTDKSCGKNWCLSSPTNNDATYYNTNTLLHLNKGKTLDAVNFVNQELSSSDSMRITVKTMTGRVIQLEKIDKNSSIAQLKKKIELKDGMPANEQRLIINGKQLEDHMKVKDYNLTEDTPIQLVLRLRGGTELDSANYIIPIKGL